MTSFDIASLADSHDSNRPALLYSTAHDDDLTDANAGLDAGDLSMIVALTPTAD